MINSLLSFFLEADRARSLAVMSLDSGYAGSFEVQLTADQSFVAYEGCGLLLHHTLVSLMFMQQEVPSTEQSQEPLQQRPSPSHPPLSALACSTNSDKSAIQSQ